MPQFRDDRKAWNGISGYQALSTAAVLTRLSVGELSRNAITWKERVACVPARRRDVAEVDMMILISIRNQAV